MVSPTWCSNDAAANTAIIPPKALHHMLKTVEEGRQKEKEQQCASNQTQGHATEQGNNEKEKDQTSSPRTDVWTLSEETATFLSEIFSEEFLAALRTTHKSALNRIQSSIATAAAREPHPAVAKTRNGEEAKPVQTRLPYTGAVVSPRVVESGPLYETEKSLAQPNGRDSRASLASQPPSPYVLTLSDTWRHFTVPAGAEQASVALAPALMAATANHRFALGPISHFKKPKDRARTPQGHGRESGVYSPGLGATTGLEADKSDRDNRPASRPTMTEHTRGLDSVEAGGARR